MEFGHFSETEAPIFHDSADDMDENGSTVIRPVKVWNDGVDLGTVLNQEEICIQTILKNRNGGWWNTL